MGLLTTTMEDLVLQLQVPITASSQQKHLAARHLIYQHQHNKQERVGSYSNVGDVVLGGNGTGSGGGSTSPSIMQRMAAKRRRSQTC